MENKALAPSDVMVTVGYTDLMQAWSVLEKLTVSLDKIGGHYAVPGDRGPQAPEERQRMLEAIGAYLSPELCREIAEAREVIGRFLPDDEAEAVSDRLEYWRPEETTEQV